MNHEQSIDDILRLLKESYGEDATPAEDSVEESLPDSDFSDFSHEDIHAELKKRFTNPSEGTLEELEESESADTSVLLMEEEEPPTEEDALPWEEDAPTMEEEPVLEEEPVTEEAELTEEEEQEQDEEILFQDLQDYEVAETVTVEATPNVEIDTLIELDAAVPEPEPQPMEASLQPAVMELLLQLGCEEEWDELETREEEARTEEDPREKATKKKQKERFLTVWKKETQKAWIQWSRVGILSLLSVLIFLYDGMSAGFFKGMNSLYRSYPVAYVLFGTQLVLMSALCVAPKLWKGIRYLLKLRIDLYSISALLTMFVLLYDGITVLSFKGTLPPQFHFIATLTMLFSAVSSLIEQRRRIRYWSASNPEYKGNRFTLIHDPEGDPVVRTMLRGGLSYEKTVYSPRILPKQFLPEEMEEEDRNAHKLFAYLTVPTVLVSLLSILLAMILNQKQQTALSSGMILLCLMLPTAALFLPWIVTELSVEKLSKREIYLRDGEAVSALGKADYLVFNDLHLFSKAKASDVGMVAYEQEQVGDLLGCLACLYATVGGPLSDVFAAAPEEYKKDAIRIRRIKRNGLEAIVDRKHVLLVGDVAFMRQYGLTFEEERTRKGRGTLCASLDGRKTAKLMIRYRMEPVFEMLVERLHREKVQCVIETFDPLIQAKFVASARVYGKAPINVVHKGVSELKEQTYTRHHAKFKRNPMLIVCASRLKLAEALIWCKRLVKIKKICENVGFALSLLGFALGISCFFFGWMADVTQFLPLLFLLVSGGILTLSVAWSIPRKAELTVEKFEEEHQRALRKQQEKK